MFFKNKNYSLVLSGGGALGIAQLGIIEEIEKQEIPIKEVIGTSMGAIIAASLAIGLKEKEIFKLFEDFSNVFNWLKFSFNGNSIISKDKIFKIFKKIFGTRTMKDTIIPLKIIATNLSNGEKKVFSHKDNIEIVDALLASMAIPGVFEEITINNIVYVDGFLVENLGVLEASFNSIIAIDVLGKNSFNNELPNSFSKTKNVFSMFEKSMRLLIFNQTRSNLNLLSYKMDNVDLILIDINTLNFKTFDFHKYRELKKIGSSFFM